MASPIESRVVGYVYSDIFNAFSVRLGSGFVGWRSLRASFNPFDLCGCFVVKLLFMTFDFPIQALAHFASQRVRCEWFLNIIHSLLQKTLMDDCVICVARH